MVSEVEDEEGPVESGEMSKDAEEVEFRMEVKVPEEEIITESTPEETHNEDDKMEDIEDIARFIAGPSRSSKDTTSKDTTPTTPENLGEGLGETISGQPTVPIKAESKGSDSSSKKVTVLSLCKYLLRFEVPGFEAAEAVMRLASIMGNEQTLLQLSTYRDVPEELMVKAAKLERLLTTNPDILEAADM